jgi:hypothetical protein
MLQGAEFVEDLGVGNDKGNGLLEGGTKDVPVIVSLTHRPRVRSGHRPCVCSAAR